MEAHIAFINANILRFIRQACYTEMRKNIIQVIEMTQLLIFNAIEILLFENNCFIFIA